MEYHHKKTGHKPAKTWTKEELEFLQLYQDIWGSIPVSLIRLMCDEKYKRLLGELGSS